MRAAFSQALTAAAVADKRVVLLTGDHGYALFDDFRRYCPDQYINAGVAEQNMVGVAAGLAKGGFKPVVYGLSAFVPVRVLEQIKIDVCYEHLPVIFIGDGAGLVYSTLGTSHQSFEDIACLRAVPNIDILSPCDGPELTASMQAAFAQAGPIYLRMGKADLGGVHPQGVQLRRGDLLMLRQSASDCAAVFLATGSMVHAALRLGEEMDASVFSVPWIKPLDEARLAATCACASFVVTMEEHSRSGGLGAAVTEILSLLGPKPVLRIGVADRFSITCGSYAHAIREHGLDLDSVRSVVQAFAQYWQMPARQHSSSSKV